MQAVFKVCILKMAASVPPLSDFCQRVAHDGLWPCTEHQLLSHNSLNMVFPGSVLRRAVACRLLHHLSHHQERLLNLLLFAVQDMVANQQHRHTRFSVVEISDVLSEEAAVMCHQIPLQFNDPEFWYLGFAAGLRRRGRFHDYLYHS